MTTEGNKRYCWQVRKRKSTTPQHYEPTMTSGVPEGRGMILSKSVHLSTYDLEKNKLLGSFKAASRRGREKRRQENRSGWWAMGRGKTEMEVAPEGGSKKTQWSWGPREVVAWILGDGHLRDVEGAEGPWWHYKSIDGEKEQPHQRLGVR